ncbi:hypothetical protein MHM93_01050 [Pseudoalteromonas sp. MM17-2]|uniref:hypothetical protein n=1 Tax=Pseudoalteromonas sp. MM17-2 TaxID=2917753 RepID=UPI001EF4B676|nr:hypothetical protein [Pseudoalteromonas sp. MM17-2]MCG7542767.1 hypothetical protein [Pseudoalteromonas sp. MM17-2]
MFILRLIIILSLTTSVLGCAATGSTSAKLNNDKQLTITIYHPTGEYQRSHNIFKPKQESVEIYDLTLTGKGYSIKGEDVRVFQASTMKHISMSGHIELKCNSSKLVATIKLQLDDGSPFPPNGVHDLQMGCDALKE